MREEVAAQLLCLNREFYQTFAQPFAETRGRLQPGVLRVVADIAPEEMILDLGCGHGLLAREIARRGHRGAYLGLDWSGPLLDAARRLPLPPSIHFAAADLSLPAWSAQISGPFDRVLAFAVLHHIPGAARRAGFLGQVRSLLGRAGRFNLSNWDFLASQRLRKRLVAWETLGLRSSDVDEGDYLLDWRRGGRGLRYVHHFTPQALEAVAKEAGFVVEDTFHSDGEGGRLGTYQTWRPARL